jgi:hypothetical protein
VIDFIELQEQCSKHEAIEKAKALIGPTNNNKEQQITKTAKKKKNIPVSKDLHDAYSDVQSERGSHRPGQDPGGGGIFNEEDDEIKVENIEKFEVINTEHMRYTDRYLEITVLGGIKLEGLDRMRCTLKLLSTTHPQARGLRHTLDLYNDDQLQKLVRKTAERLEIGTGKTEKALYALTDNLEAYRLNEIAQRENDNPRIPPLTEKEIEKAKKFLGEENLMERTNKLLGDSGIVGEERNRQILWLIYSSRKRENPLHVICLGSSGTGKTYLQEKVSRFVPEDEKFSFTAGTENAFYYLDKYDLCHKLVLIEDMDGVQYLLYPLRELQTKSWISKVVPVKDSQGNMKTRKLDVFGPICLSGTTTKEKVYEDNANRCILIHLDNSSTQQEAIMNYQRKLSAGKIDTETEEEAKQILQNVQRVLEPVKVINPWAEFLKIPAKCFKPLRTNQHYLQFVETLTWYHQYQREERADTRTGEVYIETTIEDIQIANELMKEVLLTKSDELPRPVREFFEQLKEWLQKTKQESFYSKALRAHFRMYPMKASRYIGMLTQYGYLKKTGGNRKQGFEYEVSDWQDYEQLKSSIDVLDELLETLKRGRENTEEKEGKINNKTPKNGKTVKYNSVKVSDIKVDTERSRSIT